uniref:Gonadotropin releasing hormone receptor 1/adipokinetic hormone receptor 1 n=1 Tax=Platynereis dumerilii TaxID=6359 RepID=A0A6B9MSD4_PLADU|nr:gonadotropin releasing hormone receptor 1/adipokinetic hormone receptor 1 [Platynereis dumerilii]
MRNVSDLHRAFGYDLNPCELSSENCTDIPREMTFNDDSLVSVITYTILFFIAAVGNLMVFIALFRNRHRRSRVNLFIMHLAIADLMVTFIMLPNEIGWHITVNWTAGDVGCRILMFFRTFGFYLSSFILVAISLDRYYSISTLRSITRARRRSQVMIAIAWILSAVASIPQSIIFHEERHPMYPWFKQCVTFNFFPSVAHERAYNMFNILAVYVVPLGFIIVTYSLVLWRISNRKLEVSGHHHSQVMIAECSLRIHQSVGNPIERAKNRTLKMTVVIVCVFIMCWTPYIVMLAWACIDRNSAASVNPKFTRFLFIFAVSNSCMNPFIYGMFTQVFQHEVSKARILCCFRRHHYIDTRHY